jgi:hypothetical protein
MSRKPTFAVQCSRCPRVEYKDSPDPVVFVANLGPSGVRFDDLCSACEHVIKTALDQVGKPLQKASRGADGK